MNNSERSWCGCRDDDRHCYCLKHLKKQVVPNQDSPQSTRTLLLGIWGHLSRRRRMQLGLLLVVMLASGGAELVSLGAVLPFLAVLSDPERLWQQPLVQSLAARLGFMEASELLLPATLAFAVAAVLAALVRLANLWLNGRLAAAVCSDLTVRPTGARSISPMGCMCSATAPR